MSPTNLLWELEKLRRRMKADDQELKEATTRLTRRSRGQEPKKLTEEITTKRKNTRTRRRTRYENKLEEYIDLLFTTSWSSLKEFEQHHNEILKADLGHIIVNDIGASFLRRIREAFADQDQVAGMLFCSGLEDAHNIDNPRRRPLMRAHISALDAALERLRAKIHNDNVH